MIFKKQLIKFIEWAHLKLFGHEISETMKDFLMNLSWSLFGGLLSAIVLFAVAILGGRFMGPLAYGKFSLILTYSQFLSMVVFLGLDIASVRATSGSKKDQEKAENISSFSWFIVCNAILVLTLLVIFRNFFYSHFSLDPALLWLLVLFMMMVAVKTALDLSIRGIMQFKVQSIGKLVEAGVIAILFAVFFFFFRQQNYHYYVYAQLIGGAVLCAMYVKFLYPYLRSFKFSVLKAQFSYAKLFLLNSVLGAALASLDKVMVAKYLSVFELGIYAAYYGASVNIITQIIKMFNNVLFPHAASNEDKSFTKKLNKLIYLIALPLLLLVMVLTFAVVKLYGKEYNIDWRYITAFSILGLTTAFSSVYNSIVLGLSKKFYKKYIFYNNLLNALNLVAYGALIYFNKVSVVLIVASLATNNLATIILQKRLIADSLVEYAKNPSDEKLPE